MYCRVQNVRRGGRKIAECGEEAVGGDRHAVARRVKGLDIFTQFMAHATQTAAAWRCEGRVGRDNGRGRLHGVSLFG